MLIQKKIKDFSKVNSISIHKNIDNDPDLSRAWYYIMKYFRKTKIIPMREAAIITRNIFELLTTIISETKNWADVSYIERMFREIYKVLKLKFRFFREAKEKKYYNSHGVPMTMDEFIEVEVEDRGNYDIGDVRDWINKYDLENSEVIWVTPKLDKAKMYATSSEEDSDDWENVPDDEIYSYTDKEGFIIPESDDGEDGFLFVFK